MFLSCGVVYVGELLELPEGCEEPSKVPEEVSFYLRDAIAEKGGLISPAGKNLQSFLEL